MSYLFFTFIVLYYRLKFLMIFWICFISTNFFCNCEFYDLFAFNPVFYCDLWFDFVYLNIYDCFTVQFSICFFSMLVVLIVCVSVYIFWSCQ